jgi:superfamily II DNA or RNA helicase
VPCGYIDAFSDDVDKRSRKTGVWVEGRKSVKKKFHTGAYKVVVSVGTLTVGIDWDVRCIVMARPTKSDMLFVQIIGRGLRTAPPGTPPKDYCLILDHSDNHQRLGYVTDIDVSYVGLHDGKSPQHENRTDTIKLPRECPQCSYMKPPHMSLCPSCGFKAEVKDKVKVEAGELRELKPKPRAEKPYATMEEKGRFLAELKTHAIRKGYKTGWAANQYREKFKVWPDNSIADIAPAPHVSGDTVNWIKSRLIAWAAQKKKEKEQQYHEHS